MEKFNQLLKAHKKALREAGATAWAIRNTAIERSSAEGVDDLIETLETMGEIIETFKAIQRHLAKSAIDNAERLTSRQQEKVDDAQDDLVELIRQVRDIRNVVGGIRTRLAEEAIEVAA